MMGGWTYRKYTINRIIATSSVECIYEMSNQTESENV